MMYEIINTKEGKKAVRPTTVKPVNDGSFDLEEFERVERQYRKHLLTLPTIDLHESLADHPLGPVEGVREIYEVYTESGWHECDPSEAKNETARGVGNYRTVLVIEYKSVSDTPKPMVKSNPNYHLGTPTDLQGFARLLWPLIYGNLRDTQEKQTSPEWSDYSIEVYRISYLLMTGEDSKYILPQPPKQ